MQGEFGQARIFCPSRRRRRQLGGVGTGGCTRRGDITNCEARLLVEASGMASFLRFNSVTTVVPSVLRLSTLFQLFKSRSSFSYEQPPSTS